MLEWQSSYLVPKPDGTIVAGSTEEEAGFDARPTAQGVAQLLTFAETAIPELASAAVERVWAALRPRTLDIGRWWARSPRCRVWWWPADTTGTGSSWRP